MSTIFEGDEVHQAIAAALDALESGDTPVERQRVDLKEEAGRRGPGGTVRPGEPTNDAAVHGAGSPEMMEAGVTRPAIA